MPRAGRYDGNHLVDVTVEVDLEDLVEEHEGTIIKILNSSIGRDKVLIVNEDALDIAIGTARTVLETLQSLKDES